MGGLTNGCHNKKITTICWFIGVHKNISPSVNSLTYTVLLQMFYAKPLQHMTPYVLKHTFKKTHSA